MTFSIEVRGAKTNNLKNIDVDIPLGQMTGITGRSGSGKSSLAMGTLYGEGMRRYLNALSTYTRRRITQANRADVTSIHHLPSALALRQRPQLPDVRSTVGTMTESLKRATFDVFSFRVDGVSKWASHWANLGRCNGC